MNTLLMLAVYNSTMLCKCRRSKDDEEKKSSHNKRARERQNAKLKLSQFVARKAIVIPNVIFVLFDFVFFACVTLRALTKNMTALENKHSRPLRGVRRATKAKERLKHDYLWRHWPWPRPSMKKCTFLETGALNMAIDFRFGCKSFLPPAGAEVHKTSPLSISCSYKTDPIWSSPRNRQHGAHLGSNVKKLCNRQRLTKCAVKFSLASLSEGKRYFALPAINFSVHPSAAKTFYSPDDDGEWNYRVKLLLFRNIFIFSTLFTCVSNEKRSRKISFSSTIMCNCRTLFFPHRGAELFLLFFSFSSNPIIYVIARNLFSGSIFHKTHLPFAEHAPGRRLCVSSGRWLAHFWLERENIKARRE